VVRLGWAISTSAPPPSLQQVEESQDNHFMYWVNRGYKGTLGAFTPPTKNLHSLKFPEWLKIAHTADEVAAEQTSLKTSNLWPKHNKKKLRAHFFFIFWRRELFRCFVLNFVDSLPS
jgi:hypothetical protein